MLKGLEAGCGTCAGCEEIRAVQQDGGHQGCCQSVAEIWGEACAGGAEASDEGEGALS